MRSCFALWGRSALSTLRFEAKSRLQKLKPHTSHLKGPKARPHSHKNLSTAAKPREFIMNLMSHLIAGFPDAETSIAIADALVKGGANILEIQLAFSDPSADGPAIQTASTIALEKGYSTKQGLAIVKQIHERHPETPIYIMTYGSLAFTPGVENFVKMCKGASKTSSRCARTQAFLLASFRTFRSTTTKASPKLARSTVSKTFRLPLRA